MTHDHETSFILVFISNNVCSTFFLLSYFQQDFRLDFQAWFSSSGEFIRRVEVKRFKTLETNDFDFTTFLRSKKYLQEEEISNKKQTRNKNEKKINLWTMWRRHSTDLQSWMFKTVLAEHQQTPRRPSFYF